MAQVKSFKKVFVDIDVDKNQLIEVLDEVLTDTAKGMIIDSLVLKSNQMDSIFEIAEYVEVPGMNHTIDRELFNSQFESTICL